MGMCMRDVCRMQSFHLVCLPVCLSVTNVNSGVSVEFGFVRTYS